MRPLTHQSVLWLLTAALTIPVTETRLEADSLHTKRDPSASHAGVPVSIIDLQSNRRTYNIRIEDGRGRSGEARLINLNPIANVWYVLRISWNDESAVETYHLENPLPAKQSYALVVHRPLEIVIGDRNQLIGCRLWTPDSHETVAKAALNGEVYAPLCNGRILLRNPVEGHKTGIEYITDLLRDQIPGGEPIVGFVKDTFYNDAHRINSRIREGTDEDPSTDNLYAPLPARIRQESRHQRILPQDLGIILTAPRREGMTPGRWYAVQDNQGIYVSAIQANQIDRGILKSYGNRVRKLDEVESTSLAYLAAFDMSHFRMEYSLGTDHPRVDWSDHVLPGIKNPMLPGPDGIGTSEPLVTTGLVSPAHATSTAATFTGGFKRAHGAFRYGELARKNYGSHYGFIQNGVLFSKLQPGLATLFVLFDGTLHMKTWRDSDNVALPYILHARQNGVPLVERNPANLTRSQPGALVGRWGPGNWSGSVEGNQRTLRAGLCLQQRGKKKFLIYGYFSTATPSAMARIFQAYGCSYAMHMDMNALEHTYLALYRQEGGRLHVQHLIRGMNKLDKQRGGAYTPRFLGYADNRDFFYLTRRGP